VAATTQLREIRIQIDTKGDQSLKALASQMGLLNKNVNALTSTFSFLSAITGASLFGFGVREIAQISDSMQNLTNRLEIFTGSAEEARKSLGDILTTANKTKTSVESLATIYVRLAQSTKESQISTETLLDVTKALQQTFRLSGATTTEATNAAIQLSQGLASGQLRGQELRSVLEQSVVFGDILTKSLGKTRGELFKFAEQGRITSSEVLKALLKNVKDLDDRAEKLTATFEQSTTVAFNNLKVAVGDLNKSLGVSGGFAKALEFVADNLKSIGVIVLGLAATAFPALIAAIKPLAIAIGAALGTTGAIFVGIGVAVGLLIVNFDKLAFKVRELVKPLDIFFNKAIIAFYEVEKGIFGNIKALNGYLAAEKKIADAAQARINSIEATIVTERDLFDERRKSERLLTIVEGNKAKAQADEIKRLERLNKLQDPDKKATLLARLNKEYLAGAVSVDSYFKQLDKLERSENLKQFREGKKDLGQYNEQIEKLDKIDLNRSLNNSVITIERFNEAIRENELEKLNGQLEAGKISLLEYDQAFLKLSDSFSSSSVIRAGAENYIKSIGTVAEQTASAIENTFKSLEDSFVEFIKTGKFNFRDFAQAVLDDLNRIIVRSLIIRPLANALVSSAGDIGPGPGTIGAGFASGGIVDSPTFFGYGKGSQKLGMMGEAGPEAIIPLQRGPSGDLGISSTPPSPVIVNINNQVGGEVSQQESTGPNGEKIIDVLITNKVKGAIANGQLDKTFQQAYGLRRKGS
jgi:lambda family phage tail tape measure protein